MFADGTYVKLSMGGITTGATRKGTVHHVIDEGQPKLLFRHDPRFNDPFDAYIHPAWLEECARPSDEEVAFINKLSK